MAGVVGPESPNGFSVKQEEDEEDEMFLDAEDYEEPEDRSPVIHSGAISLEQGMDNAQRAIALFMSNRFHESRVLMENGRDSNIYHALGHGTFVYMQAMMTMDVSDLEAAAFALKSSVAVCHDFRKKESVKQAVTKMVRGKNYASYSELERHAELCYAEGILQKAVMTFLEDETLASFVKGALQLRHGYFSYKECWNILKDKPVWSNEKLGLNFDCGVRLGVGAFNLLISMLPPRVLKLLEWIGFNGTKGFGLAQLEKSYQCEGATRRLLAGFVLLFFHTFVCFFAGVGDGDVDKARRILDDLLEKFPNGAISLFFSGRVELVSGNVSKAVAEYKRSIESQSEWIQFHHFSCWELMWCNAFLCDWDAAAGFARRLLNESKWSRSFYAYACAACMLMKPELTKQERAEVEELLRNVAKYKQRIAGKSIPIEKYCVRKAEKYFNNGGRLVLPAFELMLVWNWFNIVAKRRDLLENIYAQIVAKTEELQKLKDRSDDVVVREGLCLCKLLSGCCLRRMQLPTLAEEALDEALGFKCTEDRLLLPYAAAELGYLYLSEGQLTKAKRQLEFARSNYTLYSLESRLHFRVHVALNKVAELEKEAK